MQTLVPTGKTIALLFGALAVSLGLYVIARESSLFAIHKIEIVGAPPALSRQIGAATKRFRGRSLVGLDEAAIERAVLAIPEVRSLRIDRAFPNTLRVFIQRELPVAVLRRGQNAWLVAASGKVVRSFALGRGSGLPRIWAPSSVAVVEGEPIRDAEISKAVELLASFGRAERGLRLANVISSGSNLTLVTGSGIELRFGDASQAALKLAIVKKILPTLSPSPYGSIAYLDVSVPSRPVSGTTVESKLRR
jgi:cell division protein FtsQ